MRSEDLSREPRTLKTLLCSKCGQYEVECDSEVESVICPMCCVHMGPGIKYTPERVVGPHKPKGWHFMKVFVDSEGNVFHEGKEQPELKGTLEPTKIEEKTKKSTFQREQEKEAKEKKKAERYEKKKARLKAAEEKAAAKKVKTQEDGNDQSSVVQ